MAHTGRNRPGGALSHLIPVDPWSVSHTIERIVARTQRLDRKPHPNSTYDAHTVPETIAHERPPRRHLGPMLLSSRRTRGGLRHIQKLFAAGGVEDDDVLGGRAPRPPPPAAGGTLRPAPTRRPEVGSEGAGRIVPRAARLRRRTRPIDRARRIPPCAARSEGACKAKDRCLTRSTSRSLRRTRRRKLSRESSAISAASLCKLQGVRFEPHGEIIEQRASGMIPTAHSRKHRRCARAGVQHRLGKGVQRGHAQSRGWWQCRPPVPVRRVLGPSAGGGGLHVGFSHLWEAPKGRQSRGDVSQRWSKWR